MRVLLIQSWLGRKETPVFPLGLAYIAGSLRGHEVCILDPNISENPFLVMKRKIKDFRPEVVGISLRSIDTTVYKDIFYHYKTLEPTVEVIKTIAPYATVIIGGAAFSLFAEEIMQRVPRIDFGIYLEGEEAFPELLANLPNGAHRVKGIYYRKKGKVYYTGSRPFFNLEKPLKPRWDLFNLSEYRHPEGIGVQSKRGCALRCAYCTYPFLNGRTVRIRPSENVVDEIEELVIKYGLRYFMFADPVFNLPKWHAEEICNDIIGRGIKVKWSAYFSEKNIDQDFIALAQRAGCYFFYFSPDGYSKRTLKMLRKEINKKDMKDAYNLVKKVKGAKFDFNFFINSPGQDYLSFLALMWLLLKTNFVLQRKTFMHISVNVPRIEPHTDLYKIAMKAGSLRQDINLLPFLEKDLPSLYYHNPDIRLAEQFYKSLLKIKSLLRLKSPIT